MIKPIPAERLKDGDVLALPMGRTATVSDVKVGVRFVSFKTEFGRSRVVWSDEVLVEVPGDDDE